jgi:hypothetical protein
MIPGWVWRVPADWPGGVLHGGDASPVCGFCMKQEKAGVDTVRSGFPGWARGSSPRCAGVSTVADPAGGPAHSSGEAPVTGVERRGRVIWDQVPDLVFDLRSGGGVVGLPGGVGLGGAGTGELGLVGADSDGAAGGRGGALRYQRAASAGGPERGDTATVFDRPDRHTHHRHRRVGRLAAARRHPSNMPYPCPNERLLDHVPRVDRQCGASDVSARVAAEVDHRIADVDGFDERNGQ